MCLLAGVNAGRKLPPRNFRNHVITGEKARVFLSIKRAAIVISAPNALFSPFFATARSPGYFPGGRFSAPSQARRNAKYLIFNNFYGAPGEIAAGPSAPWPRSRSARPKGRPNRLRRFVELGFFFCREFEFAAQNNMHRRRVLRPELFMVRPERFELPASWFVARRSIQLSYGRNLQILTRGATRRTHQKAAP